MIHKAAPFAGRLAYLNSVIPALSHTFIYREMFELERRGYSLHSYAIHRPEVNTLSSESLPLYEKTYYLLPVTVPDLFRSHFYYGFHHPLRYLRTLWKMVSAMDHRPKDRIRSLMHFGEGTVLARRMQKDGITHVHSHYSSQPTSVAHVVHLLTGIPYSFSAHTYDIWEGPLFLREKLREARFAVCCSDHARRELERQGKPEGVHKIHLVYHGIDVRRFVPPPAGVRTETLILAVGRLDAVKGFDVLVEACHCLNQKGVDFQCRIVGEGEERPGLEGLIRRHGLSARVKLVGAVPQERLLEHYHAAALFVLPCLKTPSRRYDGTPNVLMEAMGTEHSKNSASVISQGIPNVLMEAMSTELAVVSTVLSGIPELISDGTDGFLVAPGDPTELAEAIGRLLQDPALRRRAGQAARRKISAQFDNRKTVEPLVELLRTQACVQPGPNGRLKLLASTPDDTTESSISELEA